MRVCVRRRVFMAYSVVGRVDHILELRSQRMLQSLSSEVHSSERIRHLVAAVGEGRQGGFAGGGDG